MMGFKVSTNIQRDADTQLDYVVTKNANEVYERIIHNYGRGHNSFTIIGSYGTGKSTFLWALEQHLKGNQLFNAPVNGEFKGVKSFDFVRIVGDGTSFKERFCEVFGLSKFSKSPNKLILKEFDLLIQDITGRKRALVLFVDEFGKHLEYIAKESVDEMYFIQELSEYCNDARKPILFITTLHQNFSIYSKGLSQAERSEWDKVKGRILEIAFDEPVEQLLFFAAQRLKGIQVPKQSQHIYRETLFTIVESNLLSKALIGHIETLEDLFPLDPLAADILTKTLQRYGQNERSLFTFLESAELAKKIDLQEPFTIADCFDYLVKNLSSEIQDGEKNPFKPQWKAAAIALEKAEFIFDENFDSASRIIKTICLVNIFSSAGGTLDHEVLMEYGQSILQTPKASEIIDQLVEKRIIKFSNHRSKYNFLDGTDVDIEQELIDASRHIDRDFDLVSRLEAYFQLDIIPAKRVQFEYGTPRLFSFQFHSELTYSMPSGEIDGHINLIFTKKRVLTKFQDKISSISPSQIFVLFKEVDAIREIIFEIDKINFVINKFHDDKVAGRILHEEKQYQQNQLKSLVEGALFSENANVTWLWNNGKNVEKPKIHSSKALNKLLSRAAEAAYPLTPKYLNEMVNKEYLSSPILTARKALIKMMVEHGQEKNLGFDDKKFPPEKTIYLSLVKNTGIHREKDGLYYFDKPFSDNSNFHQLWKSCEEILEKSINAKLPISAFYESLKSEPFKLKQGFLDYWIPLFLIVKKEDYSLYYMKDEYIPHLTPDVLDLVYKHPGKYYVKGLSSEGIKSQYLGFYKELIDYTESNIKGLESSYITIYGNFLRFYRGLEQYSQKTKSIPKPAQDLRRAIADAKDPESALFEKIPEALGYYGISESNERMNNFLIDLQNNIRYIRTAYDHLVDSIQIQVIEHLNLNVTGFDDYKNKIVELFSAVNKNLIFNDALKIFFTRVTSPLDIKKAYWESVCDAAIGKKLDKVTDEEVIILIDRIKDHFDSIIDLVDIHQLANTNTDNVIQLSILDQSGESIKRSILLNNDKVEASKSLESQFEKLLSKDPDINKAALIRLIEKVFKTNE